MSALFDTVIEHVKAPTVSESSAFKMLATTLESDPFLGRILTGRIEIRHRASETMTVQALHRGTATRAWNRTRVTKVLVLPGHVGTRRRYG